jgi:hypothetical protein
MNKLFFKERGKGRFIFIPIMGAAFLALISFVVMQLWNHILPDIIHVGVITFWQAAGIFILCKILFGFGHGGFGRKREMMRHRLAERIKNMTPEERARFKQEGCGNRFGHFRNHYEDKEDTGDAK